VSHSGGWGIRVAINSDQDIVSARQKGRLMASEIGFSSGDATSLPQQSQNSREHRVLRAHGPNHDKGGEWLEP